MPSKFLVSACLALASAASLAAQYPRPALTKGVGIEQKLNSLNPNAAPENMRIFSFRVADREAYRLEIEKALEDAVKRGVSVEALIAFTMICLGFAAWGYRRDEGKTYG